MLKEYLQLNNYQGGLNEVYLSIRQGVPSAIFNTSFFAKCQIVGCNGNKSLFIVKDNLTIEKVATQINQITNEPVAVLYAKDDVVLQSKALTKFSLYRRLNGLYNIKKGAKIIVATFESLLQLLPKTLPVITLESGKEYDINAIVKQLVKLGYKREEELLDKGTFTLRGDILEVYPINEENPLRFDFFGDELETIKSFDLESREKLATLSVAEILTATDTIITPEEIPEIIATLNAELKKVKNADAYSRLKTTVDEIKDGLLNQTLGNGANGLMPLLKNATADIFEYIDRDTVVFYDECKTLNDGVEFILKEHIERCNRMFTAGECFSFTVSQLSDFNELVSSLSTARVCAVQTLTTAIPFFNPLKTISLRTAQTAKYQLKFSEFAVDLKNWVYNGYQVLICTGNIERAQKLQSDLFGEKITSVINPTDKNTQVGIIPVELENGGICHEAKKVVIGSSDLFARQNKQKKLKKKKNEFFQAPETGDYAVHETHGIGIVRGSKRISTTEGTKDYVAVEYSGGDMLYVPVEQMDVLSRYLGGDKKPSLSKIGGKDFDRVKERVRASLREMKLNLKELYSERASKKGFVFTEDDELQNLFEVRFPYELTEDQKTACQEIYQDMCSEKVMDRLICGDVGFGKTEVAFRACFRAVLSHKQVAFLAPTTILCEQHFKTALNRFKDFGVTIRALNRFRSEREQRAILNDLENGKIDIIIGTHRLLSSDIKFKDLGLLVLDEEQRFGVEHKEKIKTLKTNVDTLTLSATPIPRTLHMSLAGIRDISTISTPPKERLPVQTYVTEETETLIRDAIIREISRGGQASVLYNRVDGIYGFAKKLKDLMPEIRFTVAHGQMVEKALENNVLEFYDGQSDVLVSTTIIENGIDLPRANTLIVIDADKLGLSTLYQLKGRVGRSSRLAHAYFTFKREKVLSETAYKRLTAIMEFTEIGSGFKIAMRDLEIRGAGNILGKEQHGHMDKVGYELYSKLLKEEMYDEVSVTTELDIRVTAYIPEYYVPTESGKMDAYKEIAEINSLEDENRVVSSLIDLYGELPLEVENLISIAVIKYLSAKLGAIEIVIKRGEYKIVLNGINAFKQDGLMNALEKYKTVAYPSFSANPTIIFNGYGKSNDEVLCLMREFLEYSSSF